MSILLAALVLCGLWQGMLEFRMRNTDWQDPWYEARGYEVWSGIFDMMRMGSYDPMVMLSLCSVVFAVILGLMAPFLIGVLSRSRVLWWLMVCCSAIVVTGYVVVTVWGNSIVVSSVMEIELKAGYYCGMAFPLVTLMGLLCIRRRAAGEEGV